MINLADVKGFGPKTIEKLNKKEIYSIKDLVEFFPISYQYFTSNKIPVHNEKVVVKATIVSQLSQYQPRKNLVVTNFSVQTADEEYKITAWNQRYLKFTFNQGDLIEIYGKYDATKNTITASKVKKIETEISEINQTDEQIVPIYSKINGINNRKINTMINNIFSMYPDAHEMQLLLSEIHNPTSVKALNQAQIKYKEYEFDAYYRQMLYMKSINDKKSEYQIEFPKKEINSFINGWELWSW